MTRFRLTLVLALTVALAARTAIAESDSSNRPVTVAVFGDWPYSQVLLDTASLLIDSVNADTSVDWSCMWATFILAACPVRVPVSYLRFQLPVRAGTRQSTFSFSNSMHRSYTLRATMNGPIVTRRSSSRVALL